jgi:flagellin
MSTLTVPDSVNTNVSAMLALESLTNTQQSLNTTQQEITTGLKVSGPQSDPSTYAIAYKMQVQVSGIQSVQTALNSGESEINTAVNAGQSIANLMQTLEAKAVQASQSGLDSQSYTALNDAFTSLLNQIDTIVQSASFNNVNLLTSGASTLTVLSTVDGSTISVSAQNLSVTGLGLSGMTLSNSGAAASALTAINSAVNTIANSLASLGSSANAVSTQATFTQQLIDNLNAGIGNLIDANLAQASAQLQALQIKQQLGVQALSIANAAPNSILSLFR